LNFSVDCKVSGTTLVASNGATKGWSFTISKADVWWITLEPDELIDLAELVTLVELAGNEEREAISEDELLLLKEDGVKVRLDLGEDETSFFPEEPPPHPPRPSVPRKIARKNTRFFIKIFL